MEVVEDSILVFIEGYLQQAMVKNLEGVAMSTEPKLEQEEV